MGVGTVSAGIATCCVLRDVNVAGEQKVAAKIRSMIENKSLRGLVTLSSIKS